MSKKKILLIDDELMLLLSMQRMLEDYYEITIAVGGNQALAALKQHNGNFDLVISDIFMPDIDGIKLYQEVMSVYPHLASRMILMSGANMTPDIETFIAASNVVCISKPFEYNQLLQAIKHLIDS